MGCNGELVRFYVYVAGEYQKVEFNKKSLSGWNKLTGTYDGSNLKIYLNGVIQSTLPLIGSISYNNNNSIQIGAEASNGTNPDYSLSFTGLIDEVMIYNKALTADEIKADVPSFAVITNPNSNSVGSTLQGNYLAASLPTPQFSWLRCDTSSGSNCTTINGATTTSYTLTTADTGKFIQFQVTLNETIKSQLVQIFNFNQNLVLYLPFDGAPTNGNNLDIAPYVNSDISSTSPIFTAFDANRSNPTATSDRRGLANSAYYFNGNAYVAVSNNSKINLSSNMTTSVWIKVATLNTNTGQYSGIVSKWNSNALGGYIMRLSGDKIQNDNVNGSAIALNTWYHIVNTISSSKVPRIYINGVLNATGAALQNFNGNSDNVNIGVDYYTMEGMTRSFTGSIDEVRIYNKELTATEVLNLYNFEK